MVVSRHGDPIEYHVQSSIKDVLNAQIPGKCRRHRRQTSKHLIYSNTQTKMHLEKSLHLFYFVPGTLIFDLFGKFAAITVSFISCFLPLRIWPLFSSQRNEHKRSLQCV